MDELNKNNSTFTEEESSFDIKEWLFHFLNYWYLFVAGIIIALSISYIKNRSWIEEYLSQGTLIVDSRRGANTSNTGNNSIMQGFGIQSGYRNIENQIIMLKSKDLLSRVVDSLPSLEIDYITKGRFKTRNIYKNTPISIKKAYLAPEAYLYLYRININPDGSFVITIDSDNKQESAFKVNGELGKPVYHDWFIITVDDLRTQTAAIEMCFKFNTKQSIISEFSRVYVDWLSQETSILTINLVSSTPQRDVDFIDKLCEVFVEENLEMKNDAAVSTINFINEQVKLLSGSLNKSQDELTSFRQKNQIINISTFSEEMLGRATKYDEKKRELELRELYLNYLVDHIERNVDSDSIIAPLSLGINDATLFGLVQELNSKYVEKTKKTKLNPFYDELVAEIKIIKQTMSEVIKSMRKSLDIEKKETDRKLEEIQQELNNLPGKELELIAIERKYKLDEAYVTFFMQKRSEALIQKASNRSDHSILDKARILQMTNAKEPAKTRSTYLLIGLLIPAIFVILLKLLNNKISSIKEFERISDIPLIGTIARTKNTDPLFPLKKPRSSLTEMYRLIRTKIEFLVQRKSNIMVSVSSAESGDGKTYFSATLASVYALTGKKTLLMDMDIRKPNIYHLFDIKNEPGLTNYLVDRGHIEEIIHHTENSNYDILTVGTVPPNPGELVRSEKLKEFFEQLKEKYEYIIIDTSPIGLVADAYQIALQCDINIFITRFNKTNKNHLKKMMKQLKDDNLPHLYAVLNDVVTEKQAYSKYSSYGYGYRYYGSKKKKKQMNDRAKYYTDDQDI